jgi:hypothetical protein
MNGAILYNKFSVIFSVKHLCFREKSTPGQPSVRRDTADMTESLHMDAFRGMLFESMLTVFSLSAVTMNVPSPDRLSLE